MQGRERVLPASRGEDGRSSSSSKEADDGDRGTEQRAISLACRLLRRTWLEDWGDQGGDRLDCWLTGHARDAQADESVLFLTHSLPASRGVGRPREDCSGDRGASQDARPELGGEVSAAAAAGAAAAGARARGAGSDHSTRNAGIEIEDRGQMLHRTMDGS